MAKLLQILIPLVKVAGVVAALGAQFSAMLPADYALYGLMVVAGASALKDSLIKIGDVADDGKQNNSFKG